MAGISIESMSSTIIDVVRAEDRIAGNCPNCKKQFRLSEVELFYIPDRKEDFLAAIRKREQELDQRIDEERQDAIKRSRASIQGKVFATVRPFLPSFNYYPGDLRAIWNPVDYVCFNGLAVNRDVESITFVEVKSGKANLSGVERSVREAVQHGKVSFETVTHPDLNGLTEVAEIPTPKTRNKSH